MRITIRKRIPVAGGMAGGSADAAAALRLLARHSGLRGRPATRSPSGWAPTCPDRSRPARYLATGAGERLEPLAPVAPYGVLVLPGPEPLSTGAVFAEAAELGLRRSPTTSPSGWAAVRAASSTTCRTSWRVNDLEPAALALMPEIGERMQQARAAGADHVLLSGSGPTVLGLFADPRRARRR